MFAYPNAKINLGLFVTEKRPDGFHNLESVFYPLSLSDVLEVNRTEQPQGECVFRNTGISVDCSAEKNLVVKAYKLLATAYDLPAVEVKLHKVIPYGAGLGGGSSDAAFMLKVVNEYFELGISERELMTYAMQLGSDCAYFIRSTPAFVSGRGELLEEIDLSLKAYKIVLVKPDCGVSTAEAYQGIVPKKAPFDLYHLPELPLEEWEGKIGNDFEKTIFAVHPEIREVKQALYEAGALFASMTGSGSAVYGIFPEDVKIPENLKGKFIWEE
ncbi:4-(cytidine 5'-diphospho)-2-C-methyl-D-erythritol kinase [Odoribacter lunatus]|uniref:4-(cytidine 5'-diphospho)-2-C-methyl-D-erythritol kinase n=1 Tax=Odoribacter lunatus TaxID=2941335 RepID=UPI00203DA2FE|nr:4-(cytidine 5'-diphospho)-2-C-methyl-D-erythritol kinase [Odoribacter lunatus]